MIINQERINSILDNLRMPHGLTNDANKLRYLYEMVKKYFNPSFEIAEIGSFCGVSTELFALTCSKVWSIDPYLPSNNNQENKDQLIEAESIFIEKAQKYSNIIKLKLSSSQGLSSFDDNSLDAVYIDGDHSYDSVKYDIENWSKKVKISGYICGHDYFDDIKKAVNDTLGTPLEVFSDSSWIFKKG